jgi:spermidine synthase
MGTTLVDRRALMVIQAVVFGAGFTFLIYEVSWNRQLALVLGTTVVAATIVLAAFMAGLGIGAHLWGRIGNQRRGIGKLLAGLLAGIGLFGLLNHLVIALAIPRIYGACASGGVGTVLTELMVFALASLCVFLPAFLMGGVFPLANKIAVRAGGSSGEASGEASGGSNGGSLGGSIGRLYALETLGSTIGGLATGFLFLGLLGQRNTILLAVIINLVLAVWLLVTDRRATATAAADAATADDAPTAVGQGEENGHGGAGHRAGGDGVHSAGRQRLHGK